MNRNDLKRLVRIRLREAKALKKARCPWGAYYIAGFAVECGLKACIARQTRRYEFPDKQRAFDAFEHSPVKLVKVAGLEVALRNELQTNPAFGAYWSIITAWSVHKRYETTTTAREAQELLDAITDPKDGILKWLEKHW